MKNLIFSSEHDTQRLFPLQRLKAYGIKETNQEEMFVCK